MEKMKRVLLIGKNGQVGAEVHKQSQERGYEVKAFGREELDIADSVKVKKTIDKLKPAIIVNASAFHFVPDCERYPDKSFLVNSIALKIISETCHEYGIRFVTYSTDYVFDGLKGSPYDEDDKPNPLQIYGISKLAGEYVTLNYSPKSIVIRGSGIYGGKHGSRSKKGNFVISLLKQTRIKKTIEVSSEQIISPTYSHDLVAATLNLLSKNPPGGIYHLVNEGYCSWSEFAKEIIKNKKPSTKIIAVDRRGQSGGTRRPLFSALKNTRAAKLGVKLPTWKDAIRRYLLTL